VNRQFQVKTPKSIHRDIPELLIRRTSDFRTEFRPRKALRGWSAIIQSKYNMADGRHIDNRYDVTIDMKSLSVFDCNYVCIVYYF